MLADRLTANALYQLESLVAMLFADDLAQQPAEQANSATVALSLFGLFVHGLETSWNLTLAVCTQRKQPGIHFWHHLGRAKPFQKGSRLACGATS